MNSLNEQLPRFSLKDALFQVLAAVVVHSLAIHAGINMAFSTILLPQIMQRNMSDYNASLLNVNATTDEISDILIDKDQATWIASIVTITTPVGSLLSGALMDRFGRKLTCITTAIPLAIAWIITGATTSEVYVLYIARALAGFGAGLSTVGLVYVSETSHASVRPMLLSLNSAFVSFGILLTTLLGHLMPWRGVAGSCAVLAMSSLVILFILPESPVWLINVRKRSNPERDARVYKSLKWLNRRPEICQAEYNNLIGSRHPERPLLDTNEKEIAINNGNADEFHNIKEKKSKTWKPICLLLCLFFLQQFSGGYVVIFYAIQIFQASGAIELDEWSSLIVLGVIRFIMAIASSFLSRSIGRRKLLIGSGVGMTLATLLAACTVFFFSTPILQTVCVLAFVCFSSFGFLVIPWTLIGELLPHRVRGKGSGLMISYAYLLMFATVKVFFYVLDAIGLGFLFLFFALISILAVVFVYFFIPETLGKTFEEIEMNF